MYCDFCFILITHENNTVNKLVDRLYSIFCNQCYDDPFQLQTKSLKGLPDILVFNCHLENVRDYEFWRMQEEVIILIHVDFRLKLYLAT